MSATTPLRYADGPAIAAARRARHMTQADLAEAVGGIGQVHISHIESGHRDASLRVLSRLSEVLGVETGVFLRTETEALAAAAAAVVPGPRAAV